MAVLVEAISVVVRRDAIDRAFAGGWSAFLLSVPNATFCTDGELARVGFLSSPEAAGYVAELEAGGLVLFDGHRFIDIAVVDQQGGPMRPCEWLEFNIFPYADAGGSVAPVGSGTRRGGPTASI